MSSRHALVVSYLALFIALGGTAAALQGRFSVKTDDLASGAVNTRALADKAVTTRTLAGKAVGTGNLKGRAVDTDQIGKDSVGRNKLKDQAVDSRVIAGGTVASGDLAPQTRIPFSAGALPAIVRASGDPELRLAASRVGLAANTSGAAPALFDATPGGGGGLILDGGLGPQSGYLRFNEGSGPPPDFINTATLIARDNGAGKTQLVVFWPGGTSQVLATQP